MPHDDSRRRDLQDDGCGTTTGEVVTVAAIGPRRSSMPDLLRQRTRAVWTAGDFGRIAVGYADGAAAYVERLALAPGELTLDVACGTGNLALPAARAGAIVTGIDVAPNLVDAARAASAREQLPIRFDDGDAESLPYADATFDTVMSMFGVMFVARPERALAELFRVTRGGGRIALASGTPAGFVGDMLRAHAALVPPSEGAPSPLAWGDAETMRSWLAKYARRIRRVTIATRTIELAFPLSPAGVVELFRECYGPSVRAFASLDARGRAALTAPLVELWTRHNVGADDFTRIHAEYLDVQIGLY